ncbi:hypothetical protein M9H77_29451 [Catharanthus roseus]|uniref:Uncharacterized protein n=1 Tax=Catharanthus roseus TaxID=4058 RepID=A0ACB9ZV88_CATRO|nr:hypothetical protein M9H77_29451 [Catharanthus roseus]
MESFQGSRIPKETSLEDLETSKQQRKKVRNLPQAVGYTLRSTVGSAPGREESNKPTVDGRSNLPSLVGFWPKSCLKVRLAIHGKARPTIDDSYFILHIVPCSSIVPTQAFKGSSRRTLVLGEGDPQERLRRIIPCGIREKLSLSYRREYEEYHEGNDHGAHTHDGYNFDAYGRNDCEESWRYLKSMNVFLWDGSYVGESMVKKDNSLVELNVVGFALEFDRNSLQYVFTITSTRGRRHTMEFEGLGKNVFKAHLCDLVKTGFGNGFFELKLKNLVERHLVYSSTSVDFLFKDEALNEIIVQNTKSCVKIENQSLGATLLYSLTFKEIGFEDELFQMRG